MILSEHSIKLNPTEEQFVALLDDFAGRQDPPVECRIAGGWVRDKVGTRTLLCERLQAEQQCAAG
jgi:hypothetical protein